MTKYLALIACLLFTGSCSKSEKVEWVASTNDLPWDSRGSAYATSAEEETSAIVIYPDSACQIIKSEENVLQFYNTKREIEATFRVLKTDLDLRPIYHQKDENPMAHLHLGLLAYWLVNTVRHQ